MASSHYGNPSDHGQHVLTLIPSGLEDWLCGRGTTVPPLSPPTSPPIGSGEWLGASLKIGFKEKKKTQNVGAARNKTIPWWCTRIENPKRIVIETTAQGIGQ